MRAVRNISFLLICVLFACSCGQNSRQEIEEISSHIRSILELPTFEHVYRDVVFLSRERTFLIFKTMDAEVLFSIDVRVQAGVDLRDGFSVERKRGEGLTVTLPRAKIILADADEESIHQYFLKEVGGGISRLEYYDEINLKKDDLIQDAVKRGILQRANENARLLIKSFLENIRNENVTVLTAGEPAA